jgi:hypothetical protein
MRVVGAMLPIKERSVLIHIAFQGAWFWMATILSKARGFTLKPGLARHQAYNAPPPYKLTARPEQIQRGPRHFLKAGDA